MKSKGLSLEMIRKYLNEDLDEIGLIDKYDVILTTDSEEKNEDDAGKLILNIDSILVESEKGDTLKDIEDAIIEFIKQQYSSKTIYSISVINDKDIEDEHTSE